MRGRAVRFIGVLGFAVIVTLAACALLVLEQYANDRGRLDHTALVCDERLANLGVVEDPFISHRFVVTNAGPSTVTINRIGRSCGCMDVELDKRELPASGSAVVTVRAEVNAKAPGLVTDFAGEIALHGKDEAGEQQGIVLRVSARRVPTFYTVVGQIVIDAPHKLGDGFETNVELFVNAEKHVAISRLKPVGPLCFSAQVISHERVADTAMEKVVVAIAGKLEEGALPLSGTLIIHTNRDGDRPIQLPVVLRATEQDRLTFTPDRIAFGVVRRGVKASREIRCRTAPGGRWSVEKIDCPIRSITAATRFTGPGNNELTIVCNLDSSEMVGAVEEYLGVHFTNGTRRQSYQLPISAYVCGPQGSD